MIAVAVPSIDTCSSVDLERLDILRIATAVRLNRPSLRVTSSSFGFQAILVRVRFEDGGSDVEAISDVLDYEGVRKFLEGLK
jgi:hypothetical protein